MKQSIMFACLMVVGMVAAARKEVELMAGGRMSLSWEFKEERLHFTLVGWTKGYLGLAFSDTDIPSEGFIAGVGPEGSYSAELSLDKSKLEAGSSLFHMVATKSGHLQVESSENGSRTVVEGSTTLPPCSGGLLRVFYLTSTSDPTSPISVVYLDLDKPSEAGSTFLAIDSLVETDVKIDGPSVEYKLDLGRPDGKGESRCKLFKGRSSARYYTGFSPVFSRYNGENGVIGAIRVWECKSKDGLEEYLKDTRKCNRVMPQCQRLLFSWGPGSVGEELTKGTGIKVERGHYLLLQVEYNPGTGFLTDDSGLVLHYHRRDELSPVGRLLVSSGDEDSSLCTSFCLSSHWVPGPRSQISSIANVTSVLLSGSSDTTSVKVRLLDQEARKEQGSLVTGYSRDYQVVRHFMPPIPLNLATTSLMVECSSPPCSAMLTINPDPGVISCSSSASGADTLETSCVTSSQDGLIEQEGTAAIPVLEVADPCNLIERHIERPRTTEGLSATTKEGKRGEATTEGTLGGAAGGEGGGDAKNEMGGEGGGSDKPSGGVKINTSPASSSTTMPTTTEMTKVATQMVDPESTTLNTISLETTSDEPTTLKMNELESTSPKPTKPDSTTLDPTTLESTTFEVTTFDPKPSSQSTQKPSTHNSTSTETISPQPTISLPTTLNFATESTTTTNKTNPEISTHKPTPTTTKSSISTYFPTEDITVGNTDLEEDNMALPDIHSFSLPHFSLSTLFPPSLPSSLNEVETESKLVTEAVREPKSEPEGAAEPESEPEANVRSRTDARALSEDLIDFNEIYKHEQSGQCQWAPCIALVVLLHTALVILI